ERLGPQAPQHDHAERDILPEQRDAQDRAKAQLPRDGAAFGKLLCGGLKIAYLNRPAFDHAAPRARPGHPEHRAKRRRDRAVVSDHREAVTLETLYDRIVGAAEADSTPGERIQDRLELGR